jgi:hypothetical protein
MEVSLSLDVVVQPAQAGIGDAQNELLATLSTLVVFAKVMPELLARHVQFFLPYVKASARGYTKLRIVFQVTPCHLRPQSCFCLEDHLLWIISLLEFIVPAMDHPPDSLLVEIDARLSDVVRDGGVKVITVAVRCLKTVLDCAKRSKSKITGHFLRQFSESLQCRLCFSGVSQLPRLGYLTTLKAKLEEDPTFEFESAQVEENAMR